MHLGVHTQKKTELHQYFRSQLNPMYNLKFRYYAPTLIKFYRPLILSHDVDTRANILKKKSYDMTPSITLFTLSAHNY